MFDLDGTLLNTIGGIADAMNCVAVRHGLSEKSREEYALLVGHGARKLVEDIFPPEMDLEGILCEYKHELKSRSLEGASFYPGIPEMLTGMEACSLPLAVLTNKPQDTAEMVCSHFFYPWLLDPVVGQREGVPAKPDPAQALDIIRTWGIKPEECLFLGDTATDMETALAAGFLAVGCTWGFRGREELEKAGAQVIVDRPEDVTALLVSEVNLFGDKG